MRDDKADPADGTGHGDGGRGHERRTDDDHKAQTRRMHAHGLCLLVAQCEQIDLPAQQEQRHQSKRHNRQDRKDFFHRHPAEAAHEPVCNGRKLIARIRDQLEIRRSGIKE